MKNKIHADNIAEDFVLSKVIEPLTLTIFGASGDLTRRKLIPALYAMYLQGLIPETLAIIGFARRDYTDAIFREHVIESIFAELEMLRCSLLSSDG
ncbi:MAG: hypothetical protein GKR87_07905 [Kiritimatiellae bacterium]|nr:hypothetical protein [Kiritimatiellia bacterium]